MFDELFEGDPILKWKEIIFHANPSVVADELERLLEEIAKAELEKEGEEINLENLKQMKQDLAIQSMGNILSQNE
ncbi:DUF2018 family protein [Helicobacter kayseriensis]|uniref:DUF2018 family protein n=1 Tax=Helicobacter kayseriensis TaxID=2905877 RepID=UPI001E483539|nr:DUF2018 family protein [Helicobacter kayseriensis]MCE3046824.1 DUF2018 family protein [Helicobacter kayseriensis]MCE3047874.1 DUF2018 family protein [Helicobacter kayseriensis]